MKRLFVSAAVLPLLSAGLAHAETKISTATASPVATATLAAGQPDDLTLEAAGSIKPQAAGVAVTLNSNNQVKTAGAIGFNNLDNSTAILVEAGRTGGVANTGTISLLEDYTPEDTDKDGDLDGPFAKRTNLFGIRLTGAGAFTGNVTNGAGGQITIEGNNSAGISLESRLNGSLASAGTVSVIGDASKGIAATSVSGDVKITGAVVVQGEGAVGVSLGDVDGTVQLQNIISATGFRSVQRLGDDARAKLDADDLKLGGPAVLVAGNLGHGLLLDRPPADSDPNNKDEDGDGVEDATEQTASLTSLGSAAALEIAAGHDITVGVVGTGDAAFGLVNKGKISADGVNDGVAATALKVGGATGGHATIAAGINNLGGSITANAYGAGATAVLLNPTAVVATLRTSGAIDVAQNGGQADARAIVDLSGTLTLVENTGLVRATVTPKAGQTATGKAIAIDLSANTVGATVRQTKATASSVPAIIGEVRLGSGDDRVEILGGTLTGALSFGAGADVLNLDSGAVVTGRVTDADGRLTVNVQDGRLALEGTQALNMTSLTLGAKSVLAVTLDGATGAATRLEVSGAANVASGAQFDLNLASLQRSARSYEVIHAGSLSVGTAGANLVGAPYLYAASLRSDPAAGSLFVDVKPKTAAELGLNRSGAEAYDAVFAALDKDSRIEDAILAQKTKAGFEGVYDQLLPDHSGGALVSAQAISNAISSAVSAPAIATPDGGSSVWAQEIFFHIDQDRDQAQGFKSQAFGLAAGLESSGETQAVGVNAALVTDEFKDRGAIAGERVVMNFAEGGLYWRMAAGGLRADARAGLGYVKFDSDRRFSSPDTNLSASAKWSGWLAEAHAGAAYQAELGWFTARPELSLDYLRLSEGNYQEAGGGDGFDLAVDDRKGDLFTGQALLALGGRFGDDTIWFAPELVVGYRAKLAGDPGQTTARFKGGNAFTLDAEDVASGGVVARLALRGGTEAVAFNVGGGGVFDSGYSEYDVRATIRFVF
jgi:outer membrane autotransporter protein